LRGDGTWSVPPSSTGSAGFEMNFLLMGA
jgi:hypothetical protein